MKIYKIIRQTFINNKTGKRKERYAVIQTYTTFIERAINLFESENPYFNRCGYNDTNDWKNKFNTLEEARECKKELENPVTYTHKEEEVI